MPFRPMAVSRLILVSMATIICSVCCFAIPAAAVDRDGIAYFESFVRPVLAEHCYGCHSGSARKLQASLRVDHRTMLLAGGDSGPAIVPGDPDNSLLMQAVRYEAYEMPPEGKLPPQSIEHLATWIRQGAPWPEEPLAERTASSPPAFDWRARRANHWSWQPIKRPAVPATDSHWPQNPIDHFILQRLKTESLLPAADADRRTWLRRVTFQLTGLPPTPQDYRAFEADGSSEAYERVVDRLLASNAYAETWTRHWLDLVRYAESSGHEFDYPIEMADEYRDYLLRAFQSDISYRQLVVEHLAGDLLPQPRRNALTQTNESVLATGFWHFGEATHGPTDAIADRADRIDNQIDVVSKAFLGLTIACARCHDHKFDPLSTEDYYGLVGVLKSSRRHWAALDPDRTIQTKTDQLVRLSEQAQARLIEVIRSKSASWFSEQLLHNQDWHQAVADASLESPQHPLHLWRLAQQATNVSAVLREFEAHENGARREHVAPRTEWNGLGWLAQGAAFGNHTTLSLPVAPRNDLHLRGPARSVMDTVISSRELSQQLHGVLRSPSFIIPPGGVHLLVRAEDVDIRLVVEANYMAWHNPLLFGNLRLGPAESSTNGKLQWIHLHNPLHEGESAYVELIDQGEGYFDLAEVHWGHDPPDVGTDDASLSAVNLDGIDDLTSLADRYGQVFKQAISAWLTGTATVWQRALVDWTLQPQRLRDEALEQARCAFDTIEHSLPAPQYALALTDGPGEDSYVYVRGDHRRQGALTTRRWPLALADEKQAVVSTGSGRDILAERLFAADNPFPARVAVNRIWHHLFGQGLVPTVDDFGAMGQACSHIELLDWLADDFVRRGWSMKSLIKQIVLSHTYRMSSIPDPLAAQRDPDNRWLQRMPVRRLTAESIRDQLLFLSGSLDAQLGGPSIPVHLTSFMEGRGRPESGPRDGAGRRSVYLAVRRNFLSPFLLAFDYPVPLGTRGRRSVSNVPSQALLLLNDPFVIDQAEKWAARLLQLSPDRADRYRELTEQAWGQPPTPDQIAAFDAFLDAGSSAPSAATELQDWTSLCHTIINSKDFLFLH